MIHVDPWMAPKMTVNSTMPTRRSSPQSINSPAISRPTHSRHEASAGARDAKAMPAGRGASGRLAGRVSSGWLLFFGVPQACDEIASGDADCYVEESVRRRATPPGLASSSSR